MVLIDSRRDSHAGLKQARIYHINIIKSNCDVISNSVSVRQFRNLKFYRISGQVSYRIEMCSRYFTSLRFVTKLR